jgi:hypothetical protein
MSPAKMTHSPLSWLNACSYQITPDNKENPMSSHTIIVTTIVTCIITMPGVSPYAKSRIKNTDDDHLASRHPGTIMLAGTLAATQIYAVIVGAQVSLSSFLLVLKYDKFRGIPGSPFTEKRS